MTLVVRTNVDPQALIKPVRAVIRGMDSRLPISEVRTMNDVLKAYEEWLNQRIAAAKAQQNTPEYREFEEMEMRAFYESGRERLRRWWVGKDRYRAEDALKALARFYRWRERSQKP